MGDPFEFVDEEVSSNEDVWTEIFDSSSSEDEYDGFTLDEDQFGLHSRVKVFHGRRDEERFDAGRNTDENPASQGSRKRVARPDRWIRNIRKKAAVRGLQRRDYKGKIVPARKTGPPCNCRNKCFEKVNPELQFHILARFNSLPSKVRQDQYLNGLIIASDPKKVGAQGKGGKFTSESQGKRKNTFRYYIPTGNDRRLTTVCQKAFMALHGIQSSRLKRVRASACPESRQGKHHNRPNRTSAAAIEKVRDHIKSFPRQVSHYSREQNPNKRYLNEDLNVKRMHHLYLAAYEPRVLEREQQIIKARQEQDLIPKRIKPVISEFRYRMIFNQEFNLGFGLPRSDTCATCDKLNLRIKSNPDDASARQELTDHQDKAGKGYLTMRGDKKAAVASWFGFTRSVGLGGFSYVDAVDMISFDFQQNLPTPNLKHNDAFYSRQLWTYNFGIHDCVAEKGYMYMWDETLAKRGSSEVGSCLQHFFQNFCTGAKSLVSFSDGCGGQNKNLTIIGLYQELHRNGVFKILNHKFLTRGHTFLRNDSDFAQIEKRKASAVVYVPDDWCKVVREANHRNPFEVVKMQQQQFKNFKDFVSSRYTNKHFSAAGICFRDVHWLNFGWGEEVDPVTGKVTLAHHPDEVWMRYTYSVEEPWKKVKILKENPGSVLLEQMYQEPLVLKPVKVRDLQKMAREHVPVPQRDFYLAMSAGDIGDCGSGTDEEKGE